jgi:hypothetical protein
MINSQNDFDLIRCMLLNKPTIPEYQTASQIEKTIAPNSKHVDENPSMQGRLTKQTKFDTNLIIHYTYEKRLQSNKKEIHQLWNQTFQQTIAMHTRLIVGTRNSPDLTRELIHRRPQR